MRMTAARTNQAYFRTGGEVPLPESFNPPLSQSILFSRYQSLSSIPIQAPLQWSLICFAKDDTVKSRNFHTETHPVARYS